MTESSHQKINTMLSEPAQAYFSVLDIYLKTLSFEVKNAPKANAKKPRIKTHVTVAFDNIEKNYYEGMLNFLVTSQQADQVFYEIDLTQSGIFELVGFEDQAIEKMMSGYAMSVLYPYIAQQINQLIQQANFPPLLLTPPDFEAVYEAHHKPVFTQNIGKNEESKHPS